jgi:uncharacterized membrane protein (DUF106 family)
MEEILDNLWFKIEAIVDYMRSCLDFVFAPFNYLGPALAIATIALITVVIAKYLTKTCKTRRYKELQKEFAHWYNLRQEALKCEDRDKAKQLARNIDQGKLNKVYYDYFFEGFLNSIVTRVLPILIFLAYVNEAYKTNNLLKLFGREFVFRFKLLEGDGLVVGAALWFLLSVLLVYVGWFIIKRIFASRARLRLHVH